MQRDEFLPLRVIRQELATGDFTGRRPSGESQKRRAASVGEAVTTLHRARTLLERGRRRGAVPARARRTSASSQPERRDGRDRLRRDRPRDRPRRGRAVEVRRRRAQPARLPHLRRPRGGPARAAARRPASLAQPGAAQGGGREPREPGRRLRRTSSTCCWCATCAGSRPPPSSRRMPRVSPKPGDRRRPGPGLGAGLRPPQPAALVAARGAGRGRPRPGGARRSWTTVLGDREGQRRRADYRCTASTAERSATRGSSRSRARRSSGEPCSTCS